MCNIETRFGRGRDFRGWIPALAGEALDIRASTELMITASDAEANLNLARMLADGGLADQSRSILKNLAEQKPADPGAGKRIAEAKAQLATTQPTTATTQPDSVADAVKGLDLTREGHFREAIEPLARAAEKNSNLTLQLLLTRCYVEAGEFALAEERLRKLLARQPESADGLHLLGRDYQRLAQTTLQQMVEIDADSYGVHELLGRQHEEKTEYDLAIREYQAALAKRPDMAGIRYAIGNVYRKMNQYDSAEKWLTDELARNPYHGLAHYRLGSIYTEQGKPDAAIPHLLEALASHPQLTEAQLDLGRAYTAKGRYEEAITALQHVAASDPENDRVHYLLSVAYSKEGRRVEAQTELADYQRLTRDRLQRTQQDVRNVSNSLDQ